jgi:predicted O-methyltransferase YrrM
MFRFFVMKNLEQLKTEALKNEVPIIEDEALSFIQNLIKENNLKNILEIGSGVGYSALSFAHVDPEIKVLTLEKDPERFSQAKQNLSEVNDRQVELLNLDALTYHTDKMFDLLFIDGAKTKNQEFFDIYSKNVSAGGYIVIDDIDLHGFVKDISLVRTKHLRDLVRCIQLFKENLMNDQNYETSYYPLGDGILVAKKR